ncbi:MAG: tetratricopeptide repeat protein [Brevinema sp.]
MRIINSFLLLLFHSISFASPVDKDSFLVNSFQYQTQNTNFHKGLRLIATGEFFFNKKLYSRSLPHYQEAFSLISNDSALAFRLGEVYEFEKLWKLSSLYYEDAIKLSALPENFARSQLLSYIARVRLAKISFQSGDTNKTQSLIKTIRSERSIIQSLYPEAWKEFSDYFDELLPETAVRTTPSQKSN